MTQVQHSHQQVVSGCLDWMFHTLLLATPDEQFNAFYKALDKRGSIALHDGYLTVEDISITEFSELFDATVDEYRVPKVPVPSWLKYVGMIPVSLKTFLAQSESDLELDCNLTFVEELMDRRQLEREGRQWRLDARAESTSRPEQFGRLARLLMSQAVTDRECREHMSYDGEPF